MNNPKLDISIEEWRKLTCLAEEYKKANGYYKVKLYRVTDDEVIVGARKFFDS